MNISKYNTYKNMLCSDDKKTIKLIETILSNKEELFDFISMIMLLKNFSKFSYINTRIDCDEHYEIFNKLVETLYNLTDYKISINNYNNEDFHIILQDFRYRLNLYYHF